MFYLILEPDILRKLCFLSNKKEVNNCITALNLFLDSLPKIQIREELNDTGTLEISKLLNITKRLELAKTVSKIKMKSYIPDKESGIRLEDINSIVKKNTIKTMYTTVSKKSIPNTVSKSRIIEIKDDMATIKLSDFQQKLIQLFTDRFTGRTGIEDGVLMYINKLKSISQQTNKTDLWGKSISNIMKYDDKSKIVNLIENNYKVNLQNKLNEVEMFIELYFKNDPTETIESIIDSIIDEMGIEKKDKNDQIYSSYRHVAMESYFSKYFESIDYKKINTWTDSNLDEYKMLQEVHELNSLNIRGFWKDASYFKGNIKQILDSNKFNSESIIEIQNNDNIKFIVNILRPILLREKRYYSIGGVL